MATTQVKKPYTITIEPGDLLTLEQYAALPDEPGWRTELTDGKVIKMPTVLDHRHGWILTNLLNRLLPYVLGQHLGKLTYQQEGYNISAPGTEGETGWAPDLAFVANEHVPLVLEAMRQHKYPPLGPDLVVEVISPSQTRKDVDEKTQRWLGAGTRLLWAIWPESETVEVWQPDEPMRVLTTLDLLEGLEVVPGFSMPVAELFVY